MSLEGQLIDHYRLVRLLGSGSMGEVYLAEDVAIQRQVALKVIRAEVAFSPNNMAHQEMNRLFQREVKVIATLDHPHILPLYDYGEANVNNTSVAYLVMPYRPEGSLLHWLQQHRNEDSSQQVALQVQDVVSIVQQAAAALQHAHDHQIIHQDVKPANFLVRTNQEHPNLPDLLLADFGVARFTPTATATASQTIRGTPAYMAPEQINGHAVPATDQYALAIMAYELLTGHSPFQGGLAQILYQQFHDEPALPSTQNPALSATIDAVLLKALAKQPEARFPSVTAFARALQEALQNTNSSATLPQRTEIASAIQTTLTINDAEAIYGTSRDVVLPNGQPVHIDVPPGARNGQFLQLQVPTPYGTSFEQVFITLAISPSGPPTTFYNANATTMAAPPPSSTSAPYQQYNEPTPTRRRTKGYIILAILLLLALIGGTAAFAFLRPGFNKPPITTSTHTTPVSQPSVKSTNSITTASTTSTNTVATPTPTPTLSTGTDPYTHQGTLVLNDPLQSNAQDTDWMTGTNQNNATCSFTGGAYQSSQPVDGDFHACLALATNYNNFVYEVQMTIVSGDSGGIIFRANQTNSTFYYFRVGQDGSYDVRAYVDPQISDSKQLANGSSSAIRTGTNQANIIAVVARGSSFEFYVNRQLVTTANDSTFSQGQIGVVAYNQGGLATAVYSNARVWTL